MLIAVYNSNEKGIEMADCGHDHEDGKVSTIWFIFALLALAGVVSFVGFHAGIDFRNKQLQQAKEQQKQESKPATPVIQLNDEKVARMFGAELGRELVLEQVVDPWIRITCPAEDKWGFMIHLPDGVTARSSPNKKGVIFYKSDQKYLVLVHTRFLDSHPFEWGLGMAGYREEEPEKWVQLQHPSNKPITQDVIQREVDAL